MPWCPKCKTEYRDGFEICSDCQAELVENLEKSDVVEEREEFLVNVSDEIEAEIIEGLLNSFGILVVKKYKDAGDYMNIYMGITKTGIDLFVPSERLHEAKEIIKTNDQKEDSSNITSEEDSRYIDNTMSDYDRSEKIRKIMGWVWIIAFGGSFVLGAITYLINLSRTIK